MPRFCVFFCIFAHRFFNSSTNVNLGKFPDCELCLVFIFFIWIFSIRSQILRWVRFLDSATFPFLYFLWFCSI